MKGIHFLGIFLGLLLVACHKSDTVEPEFMDRTVLVYMAADNSLSSEGYANIKLMLEGMKNTSGRLVIYFDPVNDVPRLMEIKGGENCVLDTIETYAEENSASKEVFHRVLEDTRRLFPAQSYGLILWSHGMGWLPQNYFFNGAYSLERRNKPVLLTKYWGEDKNTANGSGTSYLEVEDIAQALPAGFQFILFDACFMSSIEVLYELRLKTEYFIASPAEVLGTGFPYEQIVPFLWGGEEELKQICLAFYNYYNDHPDPDNLGWKSATIALIKSEELEPLMLSAQKILRGVTDFNSLDVWRYPLSRGGLPNVFYDLKDFISSVATEEQKAAFEKQFNKTVRYKIATPEFFGQPIPMDKYSGISTYIPLEQWANMNQYYSTLRWPQAVYMK